MSLAALVQAVRGWQTAAGGGRVVVAIDGHGGSGKTTLAGLAARELGAALVHTDDFFRDAGAGGGEREPMARYYDWERLRDEGIGAALQAGEAGSSGSVVLVEGVSSAAPALADLVTHSVLVVTPEPVRLERLRGRISAEEWDEAWLEEERVYFGGRGAEGFDLVVSGGG